MGGGGIRIIPKSMHFVWFWKVDWGGRAQESLQNQCICLVLEGWLGGQGIRNHCNICAFVLFWNVGWGSGAPEIIAKLLNLHCLGRLVAGGGAPESLKK